MKSKRRRRPARPSADLSKGDPKVRSGRALTRSWPPRLRPRLQTASKHSIFLPPPLLPFLPFLLLLLLPFSNISPRSALNGEWTVIWFLFGFRISMWNVFRCQFFSSWNSFNHSFFFSYHSSPHDWIISVSNQMTPRTSEDPTKNKTRPSVSNNPRPESREERCQDRLKQWWSWNQMKLGTSAWKSWKRNENCGVNK